MTSEPRVRVPEEDSRAFTEIAIGVRASWHVFNHSPAPVSGSPFAQVHDLYPFELLADRAQYSTGVGSKSTTPATSSGYRPTNARTLSPAREWPTRTYGGATRATANVLCRLEATRSAVIGAGDGSEAPTPG